MTNIERFMPNHTVNIFCYEGVQLLDLSGPAQVFTTANDEGALPRYEVRFVGVSSRAVTTASGLPIVLEALTSEKTINTLMIPGGPGVQNIRFNSNAMDRLLAVAQNSRCVCAICTGALIAASIGLFDGLRAVTHWRACQSLSTEFPLIFVDCDPLFIEDGNIWTSAGVTAGIDLTLALVEKDHNSSIAARVARRLVVYLRRAGGQKQFSEPLRAQMSAAEPYKHIIKQLIANPANSWTAEIMADLAGQSLRNFHRNFLKRTGSTPGKTVEKIRCSIARLCWKRLI